MLSAERLSLKQELCGVQLEPGNCRVCVTKDPFPFLLLFVLMQSPHVFQPCVPQVHTEEHPAFCAVASAMSIARSEGVAGLSSRLLSSKQRLLIQFDELCLIANESR